MLDETVAFDVPPVTNDNETVRSSREVLLGIWREACRHIEIAESTKTIAGMLPRYAPIGQILVRRIDRDRMCLETVAVGVPTPDYLLPEARTVCTPRQMKDLLAWFRQETVVHWGEGDMDRGSLGVLVPTGIRTDVVAGPLGSADNPQGLLILVAESGKRFNAQHVALASALLEPFSVALENDRRLSEMTAMHAAAEADKRTLLSKLGRKEVSEVVVGTQSGLQTVVERVELVARSDVPVLILGETGTGKELIARMIHTRSPRARGPFMRVNCGAIPSELIDSHLFGHEKGAFTGAVETRAGWFERADGGTLLLDEIGELPLAAQVRLLRILQDGWLERVGGHEPIHVTVRIVAATHRDLTTMVTQQRFREDLWYRIAVFPIRLPPLRDRPEDIPELARHFAQRAASRFVLPLAMPSPEDIQRLVSYPWPGNIRELGAVIDRAAILGDGKRLEVAQALGATSPPSTVAQQPGSPATPQRGAEVLSLDAAMRQHIENVLSIAHGRIEGRGGTASLLKINPHTLRARMRKLGIDWSKFRPRDGEPAY